MQKKITVAELFAGVGGFRLGLEGWNNKSASSSYKDTLKSIYKIVWSNQWEPATKTQHASMVYENRWGKLNHSNQDISTINVADVPDHDLLVGGFPCQDYSVATTLKNSKGLIGKKGVLWWTIHKILSEKDYKPKYLFLENVDRLLKSPATQRGRDFAIILQSLNELGYAVEWRVINAADYGMPQKRRRTFIMGYHNGTSINTGMRAELPIEWTLRRGVLAEAFPVSHIIGENVKRFSLPNDIVEISNNFNKERPIKTFENSGLMIDGEVLTIKTAPHWHEENKNCLGGILIEDENVPADFYIKEEDIKKWEYLKGAKKIQRKNADGAIYNYAEGGMQFPDALDKPSRTIITGEGGSSASRFKHVVKTKIGLRRLTPIELERLDMFPDNHTLLSGISDGKRAFFMGNALVVGVIEKIGLALQNRITNDK